MSPIIKIKLRKMFLKILKPNKNTELINDTSGNKFFQRLMKTIISCK